MVSLHRQSFTDAAHRATDLESWMQFANLVPGMLSGSTVYEYLMGGLPEAVKTLGSVGFVALFIVPVTISLTLDRKRLGMDVLGLALALVGFYLFAGPGAISPHTERYGLWLTIPTCLIAVRAWDHAAGERRWMLGTITVLVCAGLLLDFNVRYFERFVAHNSISHKTFKSGPVEPKLQAFEWIAARRDPARTTRVLAGDWWSYWAIKYLSLTQQPRWEVSILDSGWDWRFPKDFALPSRPAISVQTFYVGYVEDGFGEKIRKRVPGAIEQRIAGYGGTAVISVLAGQ